MSAETERAFLLRGYNALVPNQTGLESSGNRLVRESWLVGRVTTQSLFWYTRTAFQQVVNAIFLPFELSVRKSGSGLEGDTYANAGTQLARYDDWSWQKRRVIPPKAAKLHQGLRQKAVHMTEKTQGLTHNTG